jgi:hypothetical protein
MSKIIYLKNKKVELTMRINDICRKICQVVHKRTCIEEYLKTVDDLVQKKEYMNYEIKQPVHIDEYLKIDTHDDCNPVLYKIVVPLVQEFYYKGKHYRFTDEYYQRIGGPKGCVRIVQTLGELAPHDIDVCVSASDGLKKEYHSSTFDLQEIKDNIINIRWYNITKIDSLKRAYVETVEHYLAMGNDFVVELTD